MSLTTLFATATSKFDVAKAQRASQQAVQLAREIGDRQAESKALWNRMNLIVYSGGDTRDALEAGERSLALARELGEREQMAFTMTDLWRPYLAAGDLAAARRTVAGARPIWRELDNLPMLTENLGSAAQLSHFTGDDDDALSLALEARSVAEAIGNLWGQAYASMAAFEVYLDRGEMGRAVELMREAIDAGERVGFLAPLATTRATLAVTYAYLGDRKRAEETVQIAMDVATARLPIARPSVLGALAEIHLLAGELDEADAALAEADVDRLPELSQLGASLRVRLVQGQVELARGDRARAMQIADAVLGRLDRTGIQPLRADAMLLRGEALAAAGRTAEAQQTLRGARRLAEDLGHRRILWEILTEMAQVVADEERTVLLAEARDIVLAIAGTLDGELSSSFLDRLDVRPVLG